MRAYEHKSLVGKKGRRYKCQFGTGETRKKDRSQRNREGSQRLTGILSIRSKQGRENGALWLSEERKGKQKGCLADGVRDLRNRLSSANPER